MYFTLFHSKGCRSQYPEECFVFTGQVFHCLIAWRCTSANSGAVSYHNEVRFVIFLLQKCLPSGGTVAYIPRCAKLYGRVDKNVGIRDNEA